MNKKGFAAGTLLIIIMIVIGILLLFTSGGAILSAFKINSLLQNTPKWVWIVIIFLVIIMLGKKK